MEPYKEKIAPVEMIRVCMVKIESNRMDREREDYYKIKVHERETHKKPEQSFTR